MTRTHHAASGQCSVNVDRKDVASNGTSPVSQMAPRLLNTLTQDEVLYALAYLLHAGQRRTGFFGDGGQADVD